MRVVRPQITAVEALEALAHPVRLDLINHLMAAGPATASACARAVGDTPSNCSYHLRVLAQAGLVDEVRSEDRRERPWQALVTGFARR
jgi:DNA-binding transcriptional ArsR family regulator